MARATAKKLRPRSPKEFLVDVDPVAAAGAGFRHPKVLGSRMMRTPAVLEALQQALAERKKRLDLKADDVLRRLAEIAIADPRDLFDADGKPKDPQGLAVWPRRGGHGLAHRPKPSGEVMPQIPEVIRRLYFCAAPYGAS
jgi:hypothetical protein